MSAGQRNFSQECLFIYFTYYIPYCDSDRLCLFATHRNVYHGNLSFFVSCFMTRAYNEKEKEKQHKCQYFQYLYIIRFDTSRHDVITNIF